MFDVDPGYSATLKNADIQVWLVGMRILHVNGPVQMLGAILA